MIFSIFRFFCTLRFQIYKYCAILTNHTSMERLFIQLISDGVLMLIDDADVSQWEEMSGLDEEGNSVRTFQICPMDTAVSHWLRTRFIPRRGATQVYVEIRFTVMECSAMPSSFRTCKETFNLYYYQSDEDIASSTHPAWMENPYTCVFCVCSLIACGSGQYKASIGGSLCRVCPDNSNTHSPGSSVCLCRPGFHRAANDLPDSASCGSGQYKASIGGSLCRVCPDNSNTHSPGSSVCLCRPGFHRAANDLPDSACTRPPSAPRSIIYQINDTVVTLEWSEPLDHGGRSDLSYSVECVRCRGSGCVPCADSVSYRPGQVGVTGRRVIIRGLLPHTTYTFTVIAQNGVSAVSHTSPASSSVNITTSRDVAVPVSGIRRTIASESSVSISWTVPPQTQHNILEYQLRYSLKVKQSDECYISSKSNSVVLNDLTRASQYQVQVRARTAAGYGHFSPAANISTLPDDEESPSRLLLTGVLVAIGLLILITVVIVAVFCFRRSSRTRDPDPDKSCQFLMGQGIKVYIDPFTYEDPNEAVREFAKEIDVSFVKIEEVIGAGEFGEVCRGRLKVPGKKENYVAIKTLKGGYTDKQRQDFLSEASIMGQFQHPNIIHLEGVITASCPVMILTEYMENGALDSFLRVSTCLSLCLMSDVSPALTRLSVCLSDRRGSYGIVMWEVMSFGERPYWDMSNQDVINGIEQDYRLPPAPECPASLHQLMLDCWQKERSSRPRFCAIVSALDRLIRNPASLKITGRIPGVSVPSHPLLDQRPPPPLSHCSSVSDWLRSIKMERYEDNFLQAGFTSIQLISHISTEDLLRIGVTLAGHQKKILTSVQTLRVPGDILYKN
uniref:receptor protein-tyrosine kinase n=1 Tax=Sinocyclocheilus grahami TaxID=75366 RepID=A0A672QAV1_SINGR